MQQAAPVQRSEAVFVPGDDFPSISPVPLSSAKAVAPPPGFSGPPVTSVAGPIQRPSAAAAAAAAAAPKTAAQLVSQSGWQTVKVKGKKPDAGDLLPSNVYDCKGVWVGGIHPRCTQEEVLSLFKRFGTIKACNLGRSRDANYMFISYDCTLPPAKAVKELNAKLVPKITVTPDSPLIVRFEPSQTQRPLYHTWTADKTRNMAYSKGECFAWRTKDGCPAKADCPYAHQERNRGVDSVSWLNKTKK